MPKEKKKKKWLNELVAIIGILVIMLPVAIASAFLGYYKAEKYYSSQIDYYEEELYETYVDMTEDYYKMQIRLIRDNYQKDIDRLILLHVIAETDLDDYNTTVQMFGSLNSFYNFAHAWQERVRVYGYISMENYYNKYWNN